MALFSRDSTTLFISLCLLGCDAAAPQDTAPGTSGTSEATSGAAGASSGEEVSGSTSTSETSSGDGSSSSSSTGEPETGPYARPEGCGFPDEDCVLDCWTDAAIPYWDGCEDGPLCTIALDPAPADIRCAIEALRDQTPGTIEVIGEPTVYETWEESLRWVYRVAPSGLVARGREVSVCDWEVGCVGDFRTDLDPPARPQPAEHPVWEGCLSPAPDLNCLLESSPLFTEECIDEAFEPC